MIACIILQIVTIWENPNLNPLSLASLSTSKTLLQHPALLLLLSPGPAFLPRLPLLPQNLSRVFFPRLFHTQRYPSHFYPQDYMTETHCQIYRLKLYLVFVKENKAVLKFCLCISFSLETAYARALQATFLCSTCGTLSCLVFSFLVGHNVLG